VRAHIAFVQKVRAATGTISAAPGQLPDRCARMLKRYNGFMLRPLPRLNRRGMALIRYE